MRDQGFRRVQRRPETGFLEETRFLSSSLAFLCALCVLCGSSAPPLWAQPLPGSPASLTDWRWLARPPAGERIVVSDPWGKKPLEPTDGGFLAFKAEGPGVLDHLWTTKDKVAVTLEVDGQRLWGGKLSEMKGLFPEPIVFQRGGMSHLLAPVGFRRSLRIVTDSPTFPRYLSCRSFPQGAEVFPASADPNGDYARQLKAAAEAWKKPAAEFVAAPVAGTRPFEQEFVLHAGQRVTALRLDGSGEIVHLEFHLNPALTGSLRQVVVDVFYDRAKEPSLRLPLTDLVGLPHPWPNGRWDGFSGTLAAGLRYPWYVDKPRFHFPEATFHLNLPMPFAAGLRMDLVNRAEHIRFVGFARAVVAPLTESEAHKAGRLCGTRTMSPLAAVSTPQPVMDVPGPGQWVGLGLFTTGGGEFPPAARTSAVALSVDDGEPIAGHGLLPLWFQGMYGGPIICTPIWNHPRFEDQFAGAMRHFLTDPIPFKQRAAVTFSPPAADAASTRAPTRATAIALWYRFGESPYVAPTLPRRAEPLPYSIYKPWQAATDGSRLFGFMEAEDLVPMATAHGCEVRAVEDAEHNYHPSKGKYLQVMANQVGDYVDCVVRFPASRYFAVGTNALWGPNRAVFEMDVLSRQQAQSPPAYAQSGDFYTGRATGSVPLKARVFMGHSLSHRRDPTAMFPCPFLNPAPDADGVLRFICQSKPLDSDAYMTTLDQVRLDLPPATKPDGHEFEEALVTPVGGLRVELPKYGRFEWSGWGAVILTAQPGGKATFRALLPTGPARATELLIRGCLGPKQGQWQVRAADGSSVQIKPGKDDQEVAEWKIPVSGLNLPGSIVLEFTCSSPPEKDSRGLPSPDADLVLDAWMLK